ncbi:MAG: hypothetical protein Q9163_004728 [Psora crenata]
MAYTTSIGSWETFTGSLLLLAIYYLYWHRTTGAARRAIIKKYGCQPIRNTPELNSFPHNIIGLKILRQNIRAAKEHKFLETLHGRLLRNGNTSHHKILFTDIIQTIEVENIKTMLALNFKEWCLPTRRKQAIGPLLGDGIFNTDGAQWQHSRDLLRPNFARSQVGDMHIFECHVAQLIKAIPRDGSTVDLQELFFQMTMDTATEFLFGESTDCLTTGEKSPAHLRFADAYNSSLIECTYKLRSGLTHAWLRSKKFNRDVQEVHAFVDGFVQKGLEYRKILDLEKEDPRADDRYVFLYELAKRTTDPVQIRSELLNIFLAGRDTTASLLANVFFLLARRPDVWSKLRTEIHTLGGQKPKFQQIKDLNYLKMVLNERYALFSEQTVLIPDLLV